MKIDFKKQVLPHIIAIFIFIIVASVYNSYEWNGKRLQSHDSMSAVSSSKELREYKEKGEQILWSSRIFSGSPLFQIAYNPQGNLLRLTYESYRKVMPVTLAIIVSLMLGFYFALLLFDVKWELALIGALTFSMCTWFLFSLEASHNTKILAISYLAPLIGAIYYAYKNKLFIGVILVGIFTSLNIGANHYQITYYGLFFILFLSISMFFEFYKEKKLLQFFKKSLLIFVFATFGVLTNLTVLWTTYSLASETIRGGKSELIKESKGKNGLDKDYAMRWSYGKTEIINLIIPGAYASGYQLDLNSNTAKELKRKGVPKSQIKNYLKGIPLYYGGQPFVSGPSYVGVISVFLFLLLFLNEKRNIKWALLATVIVSIFFAWGHNFWVWNSIFFNNFPMFNKFRAPSMWLSITMVSIHIGAILSLNNILRKTDLSDKFNKKYLMIGGVFSAFILFFILFGSSLFEFNGSYDDQLLKNGFPIDEVIKDRKEILFNDGLRALFLLLISIGLIWAYLNDKLKKQNTFIFLIGGLMFFDMWSIGKKFFNADDYTKAKTLDKLVKKSNVDIDILKDESYFRVFNTTISTFNDNSTSFFHHSVGGYSAAKLYRYQDLIERQLSKSNMNVFNMLNTKYFIVGKAGAEQKQINNNANGPAWFIKNIKWADDAEDEMNMLTDFDSKNEVIIDKRFKNEINASTYANSGTVSLSKFHPDKMEYDVNTNSEGFIVFSEIWYKGNEDWKAYINGEETKFIRVNYLLRGLEVPKGNHKVIFEFHPKSHYLGNTISIIFSIIFIVLLFFIIYKEFYATTKDSK